MGKIIIDQHFPCYSFEQAKEISSAFEGFKFRFFGFPNRAKVCAKRFIRTVSGSHHFSHKVVVRYTINYDGEFLEYGFLDKRTLRKYPELVEKLLSEEDVHERWHIVQEYRWLEDELCRDIYFYENFEEFFENKLKRYMNQLYLATVIAFANKYYSNGFGVYYIENGQCYERGYFASETHMSIRPEEYYSNADQTPLPLTAVWHWMCKNHKYKKDRDMSPARPLTALTYTINRSNFERTFYAVVGLESVFTKSEKGVRKQLKDTIIKVFPSVSESDIDLFYDKRSDFAHGDIFFPDYYENARDSHHWSDLTRSAQKSTALLIMAVRELVKHDAIKIHIDENDAIVYEEHQRMYYEE